MELLLEKTKPGKSVYRCNKIFLNIEDFGNGDQITFVGLTEKKKARIGWFFDSAQIKISNS